MYIVTVILNSYKNIINFKDKMPRSEFWVFFIYFLIINLGVMNPVFNYYANLYNPSILLHIIIFILFIIWFVGVIAFLSASIRRLRDIGASPWAVLFVLFFPVFIFLVLKNSVSETQHIEFKYAKSQPVIQTNPSHWRWLYFLIVSIILTVVLFVLSGFVLYQYVIIFGIICLFRLGSTFRTNYLITESEIMILEAKWYGVVNVNKILLKDVIDIKIRQAGFNLNYSTIVINYNDDKLSFGFVPVNSEFMNKILDDDLNLNILKSYN